MLNELVERTQQMANETGNHITACSYDVAKSLTAEQLLELANEMSNKRFMKRASRLVGDQHGEYPNYAYRSYAQQHQAVFLIAKGEIEKALR